MKIDNSLFIQIAIKSYDNPQCKTMEQFREDVNKFSLVKKLLKSEKTDSEYVRLTLNVIVGLYNVFESAQCSQMLFFKVRQEHWYKLKTYLIFLGYMPEKINETGSLDSEIPICQIIAKELRIL